MNTFDDFFQEFYQAESEQETSLGEIPAMFPSALKGFPQTYDSLVKIPVVSCPYPDWDSEEPISLSLLPAIRPAYPSGFDSGGPLPSIFSPVHKPASKGLCLTNPEKGIMQDTIGLNLSQIADAVLNNRNFMGFSNRLAYYESPEWRFVDKADVAQIIMRLLDQIDPDVAHMMRPYHLTELYHKLAISPKLKRIDTVPAHDYHMLCCRDGMYCWPQGVILPHESQYYRFSHLNISAEDIAPQDTPYFDIFLENVTHGDLNLKRLILEVIGAIFSGYPCKHFFVFQGAPNSGKSQFASFMRAVLGQICCYAVNSINQLSDARVTAELLGKLLLLCSDVPDTGLKADTIAIIKELTGGDPIFANPKYKQPFCFNNSAKLLFLSNFPLRSCKGALDEAFLNRMIQIPFRFSVPQEQQIPDIHKKLFSEAGGILWKAVEALQALEERGGAFTKVAIEPDAAFSQMLIPTDRERVTVFAKKRLVLEPGASITSAELYSEFLKFDQQEYPDLAPIQNNIFSRMLKQCGLPIQNYRTASERGYRGIRLKEGTD